ncbi:MAG: diacylglycerol kinase family protein, partial [Actinomycetota bacterium]|nr:diacylglycerol kinase family protein [Actinomycetota bacterium]MEC8969783.1 diacylglycerol kinase family protein [Actinomycetota bacterium]
MSQVALLINPAARHGRAASQVDRVLVRLREHGVEPLVLDSSSAEVARTAAHHAVAAGVERIVAFGGDGIVHLAAGAVAGTSTVVGVVAGGTGNDAAEALGLPGGSLEDRVDRSLEAPTAVDAIVRVDSDESLSGPSHAITSCVAGFP